MAQRLSPDESLLVLLSGHSLTNNHNEDAVLPQEAWPSRGEGLDGVFAWIRHLSELQNVSAADKVSARRTRTSLATHSIFSCLFFSVSVEIKITRNLNLLVVAEHLAKMQVLDGACARSAFHESRYVLRRKAQIRHFLDVSQTRKKDEDGEVCLKSFQLSRAVRTCFRFSKHFVSRRDSAPLVSRDQCGLPRLAFCAILRHPASNASREA